MSLSIFSAAKSYIPTTEKDPKEDYLTEIFAWILNNSAEIRKKYCMFLSSNSKRKIFDVSNEENIEIKTQESTVSGRVDLTIHVGENGFICEHKVFSSLSDNQIDKYKVNSNYLGNGEFYTVLITASKIQHTQEADIMLTWGEICKFLEESIENLSEIDRFITVQLISYLKEQGLGYMPEINMQDILGYFPATSLEKKLNEIFISLKNISFQEDCPNLKELNPSSFDIQFNSKRWGRKGIDFFKEWQPGIFAGVILNTDDHLIEPLNIKKGPDFVILVETDYYPKDTTLFERRNCILQSEKFNKLKNNLKDNKNEVNSFNFIYDFRNPWRVLGLRKSLFDILKETSTKDEQVKAVYDNIVEGINLLTQSNLLRDAFNVNSNNN